MVSKIFLTREGVKQGGFSPLLFLCVLGKIITTSKKISWLFNIQQVEIIKMHPVADDVVFIAENQTKLEENLNIWDEERSKWGIELNLEK